MRKVTQIVLAIACIFQLGGTDVNAQQIQATRRHFSTDDGLASNAIAHMVQDDYGYIWLATWNGLSRFDGYNFFNYKTGAASHIRNLHNRITQLAVDNQQNVWMRMYDSRVFVLKRSTDCIVNPFENVSGSEEYRTTHPIVVTSSGDVLVTVDGVGLYKLRMMSSGVKAQLVTVGDMVITSIAEGYQDDIWLGTNQGVHRMDASNLTVERKGLFLDEHVTCLYSNGYNIYVGTKSGRIMSFSYGQDSQVIRSGGDQVAKLFVDSRGLIWFTDSRMGVSKIDPETHVERFYSQNVKTPDYDGYGGIIAESNGVVWIAMNRGGFGYYNRETDEVEYFHNDPSNPWNLSNAVNAMLITNEGVVFESTTRRGLEKLEIIKQTIARRMVVPGSTNPLDNEIRGLLYDKAKKQLLMGTKAGVLHIIKGDSVRTTWSKTDDGSPIGRIYGISKDASGRYWIASKDNGLFKMTPKGNGYSIVNLRHKDGDPNSLNDNRAYYCLEDKDGNLWVATYGGGVNLLPKGKNGFLYPKKGMNNYPINAYQKVRTLELDKDGKVWAGTTDGVLIMSYKKGKVEVQRLLESKEYPDNILMSNDVVCLARDAHGMMWVGTNGGGLAHTIGQDSEGRWYFEHFGAKDGLPSEEIKCLTFDSRGNVWFATDHHICSFDQGKRIFATYSNLEGVDETICSEASAVTLANGHILIGTVNGYYDVDHAKLATSTGSMLKLHITDFWLNNELQTPRQTTLYGSYVPDAKSVRLQNHDDEIGFRFASLNYQLQHRVHYQYMLEGYDEDWQNAPVSRTAWYNNLPSGTYKFKVKAFLIDSPEKYDLKEIEVIVPPSFLMSRKAMWIYLAIGVVLCVMLMFWLQKMRRRRQRRSKKESMARERAVIRAKEDEEFMQRLDLWMEKNYKNPAVDIEQLITFMSMSLADFEGKLRRITNKTPKEYISEYRIDKAKQMLAHTDESIADISFELGFANAAQFNRLFQEATEMTPSQYRDAQRQTDSTSASTDYEIIE